MPKQDNSIEITFDGKKHTLELTLGEVEQLEDAFDKPISDIDLTRTKAILYLVAFALKREQRLRPFEDILEEVRGKGVDTLAQDEPAAEGPTKPARAKA